MIPSLITHYGLCYLPIVWTLRWLSCWLTCTQAAAKLAGVLGALFDISVVYGRVV